MTIKITQGVNAFFIWLKTLNLSTNLGATLLKTREYIHITFTICAIYLHEKVPYAPKPNGAIEGEFYKVFNKDISNCCRNHWGEKAWVLQPSQSMEHLSDKAG